MKKSSQEKIHRSHITSSIAGIFIIAQFILIFFFSIHGILILRILGFILWVLTIILGWLPIYTLKKYGGVQKGEAYVKTSTLVTTGIYAIVRHPQYLAFPLMNVALALISQHWIVILTSIPGLLFSIISIIGMDKYCIEKFGDEYQEYIKQVPGMNIVAGVWRFLKKR
jgi:protein-S-isoprenylcysteine O-methyltransferase Ste14